jgi:hypothetical protein
MSKSWECKCGTRNRTRKEACSKCGRVLFRRAIHDVSGYARILVIPPYRGWLSRCSVKGRRRNA